jgi:hypothetical protein
MATISEISNAENGKEFTIIENVQILSQSKPRFSKKKEPYCIITLGNKFVTVTTMLWNDCAKWKLPLNKEIALKGRFIKKMYQGNVSLDCNALTKPDGAVEFKEEEFGEKPKTLTIKEAMDVGLRAADYMTKVNRSEFASEAFKVAATAYLNGISVT